MVVAPDKGPRPTVLRCPGRPENGVLFAPLTLIRQRCRCLHFQDNLGANFQRDCQNGRVQWRRKIPPKQYTQRPFPWSSATTALGGALDGATRFE